MEKKNLNNEEIKKLIFNAQFGNEFESSDAETKLLEYYYDHLKKIANKNKTPYLEFEELLNIASSEFINCIRKFDINKYDYFWSFASKRIRFAIDYFIATNSFAQDINHFAEIQTYREIIKAKENYMQSHDKPINKNDLLKALNISKNQLKKFELSNVNNFVSLEQLNLKNHQFNQIEFMDPEKLVRKNLLNKELHELLHKILTPKQEHLIKNMMVMGNTQDLLCSFALDFCLTFMQARYYRDKLFDKLKNNEQFVDFWERYKNSMGEELWM